MNQIITMLNEDILRLLDNNGKLLYLLMEEGALRFEEIVQMLNPNEKLQRDLAKFKAKPVPENQKNIPLKNKPRHFMSRGTIAKHLKYLRDPARKYITQESELDPQTQRNTLKYIITDIGKAYLTQLIKTEQMPVRPDQFGLFYQHITDFFMNKIGLEEDLYLPQVIAMVARIDQMRFFQLPQTDELFYALFYIFQNTLELSIGADKVKFLDKIRFCEISKLSKAQIDYNVEKILIADLGFCRFPWRENDKMDEVDLFIHRNDLIGAVIFNQIQNEIEREIVKRSIKLNEITLFQDMALKIIETLMQLRLIRPSLKDAIQFFIEILLINGSINRGFTRIDIAEYWPPLNALLRRPDGIDLTKKIFGRTTDFEKYQAIEKAMRKFREIGNIGENR